MPFPSSEPATAGAPPPPAPLAMRTDAHMVHPVAYRFPWTPAPPTPPFPSLIRIHPAPSPSPASALSPVSPATVSPPPRTSSLPFNDLLRVGPPTPTPTLTPSSSSSLAPIFPPSPSRPVPPQCGFVPPKAAALLGLFDPAAQRHRAVGKVGSTAAAAPTGGARGRSPPGGQQRQSHETATASQSQSQGTGTGWTASTSFSAHRRGHAGSSSASSRGYTASQTTAATTGGKLSVDLTRGVPRLVAVGPVAAAKAQPTTTGVVRMRQAGMASLPDLHNPSAGAGSSARQHVSVRPGAAPAPWATWESEHGLGQEQQEELEDLASSCSCSSSSRGAESAIDGFRSVRRDARRKSSFRCRGPRRRGAARSKPRGDGASALRGGTAGAGAGTMRSLLVRSLSRGSSRTGGMLVRALSGRRGEGVRDE